MPRGECMSESMMARQGLRGTTTVLGLSIAAFSAGYAMPGTGGSVNPHYLLHKSDWVHDEAIEYQELEDTTGPRNDALGPSDVLTRVREALGLSVSDLAAVLGVTRPTVYAWMKDESEPRTEAWKRLRELEQVALQAERYELPRVARLVRRPLLREGSLLERLISGQAVSDEHWQLLAEVARSEEEQRGKVRSREQRSADEVAREYGRPMA